MKKTIALVLILAASLGVLFWQFGPKILNQTENLSAKRVDLIFWGTEDEALIRPLIQAYQASRPQVQITYIRQSLLNYRTRVQTQIRAFQGPDVFFLHSSWMPLFFSDLSPAPEQIMTLEQYKQAFYPIFSETLISQGKIYALPTEVDNLGLYYNEDILKAAGVALPKTWTELVEAAQKVTVKNQEGQIQTAGVALGAASNIDFWPEILGLLFSQQPGANLASPATGEGAEVLRFYTSFILDPQSKTWDITLPPSTQMFSEGKLGFYFAPASQVSVIKALNPSLNFKVAPLPQLPGKTTGFGGFWVWGISATSKSQTQSWEFLKFLTSVQAVQFLNQKREEAGISPKSYARVELASQQANDPFLGTFVTQAPYVKTWYLNSGTEDRGVNEEIIASWGEAINGVLQGRDPLQMLQITQASIKQILDKYKIEK